MEEEDYICFATAIADTLNDLNINIINISNDDDDDNNNTDYNKKNDTTTTSATIILDLVQNNDKIHNLIRTCQNIISQLFDDDDKTSLKTTTITTQYNTWDEFVQNVLIKIRRKNWDSDNSNNNASLFTSSIDLVIAKAETKSSLYNNNNNTLMKLETLHHLVTALQLKRLEQYNKGNKQHIIITTNSKYNINNEKNNNNNNNRETSISAQQQEQQQVEEVELPLIDIPSHFTKEQRDIITLCCQHIQNDYNQRLLGMKQRYNILYDNFCSNNSNNNKDSIFDNSNITSSIITPSNNNASIEELITRLRKPHSWTEEHSIIISNNNNKQIIISKKDDENEEEEKDIIVEPIMEIHDRGGRVTEIDNRIEMPVWTTTERINTPIKIPQTTTTTTPNKNNNNRRGGGGGGGRNSSSGKISSKK